jgi:hypothetical protein
MKVLIIGLESCVYSIASGALQDVQIMYNISYKKSSQDHLWAYF